MHKKNPYIDIINANGHDFVEIGGIKWSTCNIGADKPWEFGLYFAWGETDGYSTEDIWDGKRRFDVAEYKFGFENDLAKYCAYDGKMFLELEDDAAHAHFGGGWRMPTMDEFAALGRATNTAWATNYEGSGISGLVLTDKTDSSKVLFFPAAGFCINGSVNYVGSSGNYWSSSLGTSNMVYGCYLYFASSYVYWQSYSNRYIGFAVRGVLG